MPFDGKNFQTKPIDRLIEALRGPEPSDWNFSMLSHCACGLARRIGIITDHISVEGAGKQLGLNEFDALTILGLTGVDHSCGRMDMFKAAHLIRPRHVAAALELYRDTGEALSPFEFVKREG